jgi:Flp pilus assembly protein CpaB
VWLTLTALAPGPEGPRTDVVVAAHDLPSGHVLTGSDLIVRSMPLALVPSGTSDTPRLLRGRTLSGPVRAGAAFTDADLSVAALARGQPDGGVVAHVSLSSASLARAATPGTHVEVVSTADGTVLADDAVVLDAHADADSAEAPGVFVAVTAAQARQIAGSASAGQPPGGGAGLTLVILPAEGSRHASTG